jgi:hypothetical protein
MLWMVYLKVVEELRVRSVGVYSTPKSNYSCACECIISDL